MTNPEPVEPPSFAIASIETTDGKTLCAISATEPTGRSMLEDDLTRLTERPKSEPVEDAPNVPAISPTTIARTIADFKEIERLMPLVLGALHQGPWLNSLTMYSP